MRDSSEQLDLVFKIRDARSPRTMTDACRFLANSTVRPSKLSTLTFGMPLQHSVSSATRSSTVNSGSFALLISTATIR